MKRRAAIVSLVTAADFWIWWTTQPMCVLRVPMEEVWRNVVETASDAYCEDTGADPPEIAALYEDPGLEGWNGPYLVRRAPQTTFTVGPLRGLNRHYVPPFRTNRSNSACLGLWQAESESGASGDSSRAERALANAHGPNATPTKR